MCGHAQNQLVRYIKDRSNAEFAEDNGGYGYFIAACLFVAGALSSVLLHNHHYLVMRDGMRIRTALVNTIYRKALRLTLHSKQTLTSGMIQVGPWFVSLLAGVMLAPQFVLRLSLTCLSLPSAAHRT